MGHTRAGHRARGPAARHPSGPGRPARCRDSSCCFPGRLTEARERLLAVRQRAIERGDESDLSFFLCWLAWLEMQAGNLQTAQAHAEEAALVADADRRKVMRAFSQALMAIVSAHRGDIERSRRECTEAGLLAAETTYAMAGRWIVVGVVWPNCPWTTSRRPGRRPSPLLVTLRRTRFASRSALHFFRMRSRHSLHWASSIERRHCSIGSSVVRRSSIGCGRWRPRRAAMGCCLPHEATWLGGRDCSRRCWSMSGWRCPLSWLARCCGSAGWSAAASCASSAPALNQALEIFEQLGTPLWAAKARAELERTHLREAPAELTPSEQRVAELAGERTHQPADRGAVVHESEDRRGKPEPRVQQAGHRLAGRARGEDGHRTPGMAIRRETPDYSSGSPGLASAGGPQPDPDHLY